MKDISIINIDDYYIDIEGIYNIKDYETVDSLMSCLESKYILFTKDLSNLNLEKLYNLRISEEDNNADIIMFLDYMDFLPNKVDINFFKINFLESLFINFKNILFNRDLIKDSGIEKDDFSSFFLLNYKIFNKKLNISLKEENICKKYNNLEFNISDIFKLGELNNKQKYIYIYNIINKIISNINNLDKRNIEKIFEILKDEIHGIDNEDYNIFLKTILDDNEFDLISSVLLIIKCGSISQFRFLLEQINRERENRNEIKKINLEYDKLSFITKSQNLSIIIIYDRIITFIKQVITFVQYVLSKPFFLGKDLWLIGERTDQAEDNSFIFFKYVRENHPNAKIYYIIDKNSIQCENVKKLGNVIDYNSFKHKIYLMHASKLISAYDFFKFLLPNDKNNNFKQYNTKYMNSVRVFLQHGVSMNKANYYNKYINKYDYLLASTTKELNMFTREYEYDEDKIIKIGLPRFDQLTDESNKNKKRKILFMPTWRSSLVDLSKEDFKNTEYYKAIDSLINDSELNRFIEENDLELIVYLHYEMQIFNECFNFYGKNISFRDRNNAVVQELLKECNLLITDYSSVGVDFAYLNKPVIFYQFSRHNFHYNINKEEEYTIYSDFGKVISRKADVIISLREWKNNNYNNFYVIDDNLFFYRNSSENCKRIYEFIKEIPKKKDKKYIIEISKDNSIKEKRIYDNNYNFIERIFYNKKIKTSKLIYKDGFINKQIVYSSNNKIMKKVKFYKGVKISTEYIDVYDKKGNLLIKHDVINNDILKSKTIYYPNSNKVKSISKYNIDNEKLSSIEQFYKNGILKSYLIYTEDGIAQKYYYYSEDGKKIREYDYYESGHVKYKKFYSSDKDVIIKIQNISEINNEIISEEIFDINGIKVQEIKYRDF
ncbi:CDP-glycerol glycerophosphotransferase family protein [Clostridium tertium]